MTEHKEQRREQRFPLDCPATLKWEDSKGQSRFLEARALDISDSGIRVETSEMVEARTCLYVWVERYNTSGTAVVRHCTRRGHGYVLGMEFSLVRGGVKFDGKEDFVDYYELLQVSPNAEHETIRRVYRLLAARYHPDNSETGDQERFTVLNEAYNTLVDPEKRLDYDTKHQLRQGQPMPVFEMKEFVEGVEGEVNRRLGILYLLYQRRRLNSDDKGVSLLEFENLMAFPREHLTFALWFLKDKQYIHMGDHSDYVIASAGVEFLESHIPSSPILRKLLESPRPKPEYQEQEREYAMAG